eukprot:COSAG06_NODE_16_length_34949_cov_31.500832_31_plen_26_part_01
MAGALVLGALAAAGYLLDLGSASARH